MNEKEINFCGIRRYREGKEGFKTLGALLIIHDSVDMILGAKNFLPKLELICAVA